MMAQFRKSLNPLELQKFHKWEINLAILKKIPQAKLDEY